MKGDRVIGPAVKYQVEFSNKLHLPNGTTTQEDPLPVGGGGPSVAHQIGIASHVSGRAAVTNPDIVDLIDAYRLSNKCRGKVTVTCTTTFCTPIIPIRTRKLAWRHVMCL